MTDEQRVAFIAQHYGARFANRISEVLSQRSGFAEAVRRSITFEARAKARP